MPEFDYAAYRHERIEGCDVVICGFRSPEGKASVHWKLWRGLWSDANVAALFYELMSAVANGVDVAQGESLNLSVQRTLRPTLTRHGFSLIAIGLQDAADEAEAAEAVMASLPRAISERRLDAELARFRDDLSL